MKKMWISVPLYIKSGANPNQVRAFKSEMKHILDIAVRDFVENWLKGEDVPLTTDPGPQPPDPRQKVMEGGMGR